MENRPAPLRSRRVCRFCLTESEPLNFMYERDHSKPFQVPLTLQIMSCVAIEVYSADGMPQMICSMCRWNLDRSYKFKQQCKKADEALRAYPVTGVLPRPFPPISNEGPDGTTNKRSADQRLASDVKKPRVDNGDRERRERERDRQESNLKADRNDIYKEHHDSEGDDEAMDDKEDRKLEPGEIRVHACDQCDRTFPLRQSLQLHIDRAHRDRNFKCTVCERMFFSKYDLQKHMTTHSDEKPFSCKICNKSFTRANLLQRHEKVHREELRYSCQHCDREFFTCEELEKHENNSHKTAKPYQCNICNKRFTYKQGLERHEMLHAEDKSFTCEYCKEAFRTSTKLARHLQTHAGHRPYMCKLCPRTFLLSHHLTRHMRSHSVEKRHICEECGKAFKRKESLEVHQLTHTKRTGMGLTCDVCQESCRNRADYVTHIKQHIEAGEKMGPDGLQPDKPEKIETESEEEDDVEPYSDGDDDYQPPHYVAKKYPKQKVVKQEEESEEDQEHQDNKEERKEQVVFVRGKDGHIVKKTIKTLMPIQRREVSETKTPSKSSSSSSTTTTTTTAATTSTTTTTPQAKVLSQKQSEETPKVRVDDTEAEVQKIVASVFKEHKIPLKQQNIPQEQVRESAAGGAGGAGGQSTRGQAIAQAIKEEKSDSTPKSVNTVKVIKRIVMRKPAGVSTETTSGSATSIAKDAETPSKSTVASAKVTKRVIVRRIIRQGDTTREVIMNPDGTIIDPSELAKLPTGNVVKRVVVKKPAEKSATNVQVLPVAEQAAATVTIPPKFELKTSQTNVLASNEKVVVQKVEVKKVSSPLPSKADQETKEKLEQLEKRVEQQRLKIEELQARKQQECEAIDDMLPERHDSEDEQELPLKRVFVKRKQSIYDEEQEYHDGENKSESKDVVASAEMTEKTKEKVTGKKVVYIKAEEPSEVEQMTRDLSSMIDSAETIGKMQQNVLSSLTEVSGIPEKIQAEKKVIEAEKQTAAELNEIKTPLDIKIEKFSQPTQPESEEVPMDVEDDTPNQSQELTVAAAAAAAAAAAVAAATEQELPETTDIFEPSDSPIAEKSNQNLNESVIALSETNDTINLNDTNDSQDSLEDKLSQMEG